MLQGLQSTMPEAGGNVLPMMVQPLVGAPVVQGSELRAVRPHLYVIESIPYLRLHLLTSGIQCEFQARIRSAQVRGKGKEGRRVVPFPEEKKTVNPEVVRYEGIHHRWGQFLTYIQFEEGRMAADTVPQAVAYINRQ